MSLNLETDRENDEDGHLRAKERGLEEIVPSEAPEGFLASRTVGQYISVL